MIPGGRADYTGGAGGESKGVLRFNSMTSHLLRGAARSALVLALCLLAGGACVPAGEAPAPKPRGTVVLPSGRTLSVELARSRREISRGLMYREEVPAGEGMLFFMGRLGLHSFWMKNCLTALDIIWLNERWEIVHVERGVPPCREEPCPNYAPMQASLYVLEVGPGESEKLGLRIGARITYLPPPGQDP